MNVSTNYREITRDAAIALPAKALNAWQDARIPGRQYDLVKYELDRFRRGIPVAPFDTLIAVLRKLPAELNVASTRLLDVGASSGFYNEVLRKAGFAYDYVGVDFSPVFVNLAGRLYPKLEFHCAEATALPFPPESFPVVVSGGCLMHVREYERALGEIVRVSGRYVILHRTTVDNLPTRYFLKDAYGVRYLEIWFNETELYDLFRELRLSVLMTAATGDGVHPATRTYLLEKEAGALPHFPA